MTLGWVEITELVLSAVGLLGGAYLLVRGSRNAATWALVGWVACLASIVLVWALVAAGTLPLVHAVRIYTVQGGLALAAWTAFGATYARRVGRGTRVFVAALFLVPMATAALVLARPTLLVSAAGPLSAFGTHTIGVVFVLSHALPLFFLAHTLVRHGDGPQRTRILWAYLAVAFANVHDGGALILSTFVSPWVGSPWDAAPLWLPFLFVPGIAVVALLGLGALQRLERGRPMAGDRALFLVSLYSFPIAAVNLFGVHAHVLFDSITVLLILYGVARYQVLDIDLGVKWTVRRSTLVAPFAVAFLLASEAAERLLGVEGTAYGLGAAVAIGLLFRRIERAADRLAERLVPGHGDADPHWRTRRLEIYRAALHDAVVDGAVLARERAVLARVRERLGIAPEEADAIEGSVLAASAPRHIEGVA